MAQSVPPNWTQVVGAFGQFVTWILVIVGWVVVNRQHDRRETRKEIRARLNELRDDLCKLEHLAEKYHIWPNHQESSARRIKVLLKRIGDGVDQIRLLNRQVHDARLVALRQAITYRNFDTESHRSQDLSGPLIAGINASVDELINALESGFRTRFPVI
ncbi:MAG: hypothetical protein ACYDA4_11720 [Ignavibacteriaceae bacterium]